MPPYLVREIKASTGRTPGALPGLDQSTPLAHSLNVSGPSLFPTTVHL